MLNIWRILIFWLQLLQLLLYTYTTLLYLFHISIFIDATSFIVADNRQIGLDCKTLAHPVEKWKKKNELKFINPSG